MLTLMVEVGSRGGRHCCSPFISPTLPTKLPEQKKTANTIISASFQSQSAVKELERSPRPWDCFWVSCSHPRLSTQPWPGQGALSEQAMGVWVLWVGSRSVPLPRSAFHAWRATCDLSYAYES